MSLSLPNPSLGLGLNNRILGGLALPGSSTFAMRDLWGNGEQGVWYEPYDPNALHQRRNLLTFTDQFDNAAWTKTGSTVTANAYSDRWDKIVEDTSTGGHSIQSANINASAGFVHSAQVKFKAGERDKLRALLSNSVVWGGVNPSVSVDLVAVTATPANGAANATLTALGNGEFLLTFTATATTDGTSGLRLELRDAAGATSYTGVATNGAFATDAQFERAASPTSYQRVTDWNTEYMATADGLVTMFQDAAGNTPVTAVEQPVGLMLDKRLGLARGPELVTNGSFGSAAGWTLGAYWSVSGGALNLNATDATASNADHLAPADFVTGKTYEVTFDYAHTSGVPPTVFVRGAAGNFGATNGRKTLLVVAGSSVVTGLRVASFAAGVSSIDNLSIRELPGNHASQSTAAARPVLSARKNLLIKTEQLNDATWIKSRILTTTAEATTAPDGTQTAELIIEDTQTGRHNVRQGVAKLATAIQYTTTCYLKAAGRNFARVELSNSNESAQANVFVDLITGAITTAPFTSGGFTGASVTVTSAGNGWWRVSLTATTETDTMVNSWVNLSPAGTSGTDSYTGDGVSGIYIWGAQLEHGPTATRYQRVNTSTDYDNYGFPHYLKFDGVDDFLVTGAIDFTATDEMTVWAGVTKLSDAAAGVIAELSVNSTVNPGNFGLFAPGSVGNNYMHRNGGTLNIDVFASGFVAPHTAVLTGQCDIGGDLNRIRVNTAVTQNAVGDQGTGNYGNYPLYIGRRGGASLAFNGQIFSLSVRGAASTATQVKEAERAVASKTGVVLP